MTFFVLAHGMELCRVPLGVVVAPRIGGTLQVVHKQDLLGKVEVAITRSFPDQESLRRGDGYIIHVQMEDFHLNQ